MWHDAIELTGVSPENRCTINLATEKCTGNTEMYVECDGPKTLLKFGIACCNLKKSKDFET